MNPARCWPLLLALVLSTVAGPAHAVEETHPDPRVVGSSFLHYHPDLRHRVRGVEAHEAGDHATAYDEFRKAAYWADKAAQAMVAEMLWNGEGTPVDRPLAYAWMDLAAERGWPLFLAKRERLWQQLDDRERTRALAVGAAVYAEYGDAVAQPRLAGRMTAGRRKVVGSNVGFVGNVRVLVQFAESWMRLDGETYYRDRYWKPDEYFAWQDRVWRNPPAGWVEVRQVTPAEAPAH